MQFTDSHIHLQDYKEKNVQEIINDMKRLGFSKIICASSKPCDWNEVAKIATNNSEFVIPAFGIHPWYVTEADTFQKKELNNYLVQFSNAIIGECGLDNLKDSNKELQEQFFNYQIELAKDFNRPICIHALKADNQIEKLLNKMPNKFMMHAFSGSLDFLKKVIKYGGYVSLSVSIKKKKKHIDILKIVPINKLLIESDGPYMSNYSEIDEFTSYVAKIKNTDKIELVKQVYQNFEEFCRG